MKFRLACLAVVFSACFVMTAQADEGEARARALGQHLRCMVCEGQTIEESNAGLAADMRRHVRQRIAAGDSDADIVAGLVARYGDSVSLRPPVKASTLPLWLLPPLVLVAGIVFFWRQSLGRRRRR